MHRKLKEFELRQLWQRDPNIVIAKYREAVSHDGSQEPDSTLSLREMIEAIVEHEDAQLTSSQLLRSIAA